MELRDTEILDKETTINKKETTLKKRDSRSTLLVILAVVLFLLSSTFLAVVFLYMGSRDKKEEPATESVSSIPEITYTESEVEAMLNDAIAKTRGETEARVTDEMNNRYRELSMEDYGVLMELRNVFSDQMVLTEGNHFSFFPIDFSLKQNTLDPENFINDEETGRMYYMEDGETVSSQVGVDVSSFQKKINWSKVKASGVDFAIIRCGFRGYESGKIVEDTYFKTNIQGAIDAGIDVGVYFYTQAISEEEAIEEADYMLELVEPYEITYPLVVDIEAVNDKARTDELTVEERSQYVKVFCDRIKEAGYNPMVYSNLKFIFNGLDAAVFNEYDMWYAHYSDEIYYPYEIAIWQYTEKGYVDGIGNGVDLNIGFKRWED